MSGGWSADLRALARLGASTAGSRPAGHTLTADLPPTFAVRCEVIAFIAEDEELP